MFSSSELLALLVVACSWRRALRVTSFSATLRGDFLRVFCLGKFYRVYNRTNYRASFYVFLGYIYDRYGSQGYFYVYPIRNACNFYYYGAVRGERRSVRRCNVGNSLEVAFRILRHLSTIFYGYGLHAIVYRGRFCSFHVGVVVLNYRRVRSAGVVFLYGFLVLFLFLNGLGKGNGSGRESGSRLAYRFGATVRLLGRSLDSHRSRANSLVGATNVYFFL